MDHLQLKLCTHRELEPSVDENVTGPESRWSGVHCCTKAYVVPGQGGCYVGYLSKPMEEDPR